MRIDAIRSTAFHQTDITAMSDALDQTLCSIADGDELLSDLTARDIRRKVAAAIIAEARTGTRDVVLLKNAGLAAVMGGTAAAS